MVEHVLKEEFPAALYASVKKGTAERHAKVRNKLFFRFSDNTDFTYLHLIYFKEM